MCARDTVVKRQSWSIGCLYWQGDWNPSSDTQTFNLHIIEHLQHFSGIKVSLMSSNVPWLWMSMHRCRNTAVLQTCRNMETGFDSAADPSSPWHSLHMRNCSQQAKECQGERLGGSVLARLFYVPQSQHTLSILSTAELVGLQILILTARGLWRDPVLHFG